MPRQSWMTKQAYRLDQLTEEFNSEKVQLTKQAIMTKPASMTKQAYRLDKLPKEYNCKSNS